MPSFRDSINEVLARGLFANVTKEEVKMYLHEDKEFDDLREKYDGKHPSEVFPLITDWKEIADILYGHIAEMVLQQAGEMLFHLIGWGIAEDETLKILFP